MQMQEIGTLQSVQVGAPHRYAIPGEEGKMWRTSFFREPSAEPRWLHRTHLDDNTQADKKNHGGLDQAVLFYAAAHYPLWAEELHLPAIGPGGFGENFTVVGLSEATVCVGDVYALDQARIQVSGPRYPCYKIARRWNISGLTERVAATGRTGWYARVLAEGLITPGMPLLLVERPYPQWTIALVNDLGHGRNHDVALAKDVASCPLMNQFWRTLITKRLLA